jgi:putrescine transport system permease protein
LRNNGLINNVLMGVGVIHEPLVMMQTDFAMYIGIVYSYLPFMILPLYSNLEKHDHTLLEAAVNLGATPFMSGTPGVWRLLRCVRRGISQSQAHL